MSAANAWMPFYVGDYLGDTQRLTTEQHGAYLLLILDYWRNGPAPDDDAILQQITRLDKPSWRRNRPALEKLFSVSDGVWRHGRIERELANAQSNAERRADKAKTAAKARWEKAPSNAASNAASNASSMPQALLVECPPPSPSSSKTTIDKSIVERARAARLPKGFVVPGEWRSWAASERDWPSSAVAAEAECFVDYWTAKAGRDGAKLDWEATWRNWIRNSRRVVAESVSAW